MIIKIIIPQFLGHTSCAKEAGWINYMKLGSMYEVTINSLLSSGLQLHEINS